MLLTHGLFGLGTRIFRSGNSLGFSLPVFRGAGVFKHFCIYVSGHILAVVFYLRVVVLCSVFSHDRGVC